MEVELLKKKLFLFVILITFIFSTQTVQASTLTLTPIMGSSILSSEQMIQYMLTNNPDIGYSNALGFVSITIDEAGHEGVRADVALILMMKETNFLKFGGDVKKEQNNFGGLGATGNGVPGCSFPDLRTGIRAIIQHLKGYATTEPLNNTCVDPRYRYLTLGSAQYVEWLGINENPNGFGWATDPGYGYDIVNRIKSVAKITNYIYAQYDTHIQNIGWISKDWGNDYSNIFGRQLLGIGDLRLEALRINLKNPMLNMQVKYQAHVQNIGWQNWVENGNIAGTTGQSLRMEAIKIVLENAPSDYHIEYQVYIQNTGWTNWVKDGQVAGTTGQSLALQDIKIRIVKDPGVKYQAHVQNIGWQNYVENGELSGTTGQSLRIEALNMSLEDPMAGMKLSYQVHVQNIGWMDLDNEGEIAGTTGQSLRIEAVRIFLEGAPTGYHVQYQTHIQNIGWQGWVQDGQISGTTGQALRIEGIKIRLVKD